jgi:redox-sensing transcriptional repressor
VVLVGVGNLGHALAGYAGFASRGFRIAGLLDADPRRIGEVVHGMPVRPVDALADTVDETGASIGVIATPADAAQEVCDQLVAAGITSILNFAPVHLDVPDGVDLRKVDLAVELQILSFHEARKDARRARHVRSGEADASQHDATRDARDAPGTRRAADLHPEPDFHPEPEFDPAFEPAEELA